MSQNQIKPTHKLLHFIKKNQEIVSRSNALTILSFQNQEIIQRSNALTILAFQTWEDCFKVQCLNDSFSSFQKSRDRSKVQRLNGSLLLSKIKRSFKGPMP